MYDRHPRFASHVQQDNRLYIFRYTKIKLKRYFLRNEEAKNIVLSRQFPDLNKINKTVQEESRGFRRGKFSKIIQF